MPREIQKMALAVLIFSEGFVLNHEEKLITPAESKRYNNDALSSDRNMIYLVTLTTNYCLWTVMSEQNLQSCLKLRNSQNP